MRVVIAALSRIEPNLDQPRRKVDQQELQRLSGDIAKLGLLQSLIAVRQGETLRLIDGHRRYAAQRAVPCTPLVGRRRRARHKTKSTLTMQGTGGRENKISRHRLKKTSQSQR